MTFDEIIEQAERFARLWVRAEELQVGNHDLAKQIKRTVLQGVHEHAAVAVHTYRKIADVNSTMAMAFANSLADHTADDPIRPRHDHQDHRSH